MKSNEIYIDGVDVAGCEHYCEKINTGSGVIQNPLKQGFCLHNITGLQNADIYFRMLTFPKCREQSNCYYKQLKRLEQERDELKKSCEKCKLFDIEKTNRDLLERIDKLEQENKELKERFGKRGELMCNCAKQRENYRSALKKIKDLCIHYENTNDKCITNCYAHFIVTDLIQNKINEVLQQKVDLGFWDKNGNYKEDIQEVDKREL